MLPVRRHMFHGSDCTAEPCVAGLGPTTGVQLVGMRELRNVTGVVRRSLGAAAFASLALVGFESPPREGLRRGGGGFVVEAPQRCVGYQGWTKLRGIVPNRAVGLYYYGDPHRD